MKKTKIIYISIYFIFIFNVIYGYNQKKSNILKVLHLIGPNKYNNNFRPIKCNNDNDIYKIITTYNNTINDTNTLFIKKAQNITSILLDRVENVTSMLQYTNNDKIILFYQCMLYLKTKINY